MKRNIAFSLMIFLAFFVTTLVSGLDKSSSGKEKSIRITHRSAITGNGFQSASITFFYEFGYGGPTKSGEAQDAKYARVGISTYGSCNSYSFNGPYYYEGKAYNPQDIGLDQWPDLGCSMAQIGSFSATVVKNGIEIGRVSFGDGYVYKGGSKIETTRFGVNSAQIQGELDTWELINVSFRGDYGYINQHFKIEERIKSKIQRDKLEEKNKEEDKSIEDDEEKANQPIGSEEPNTSSKERIDNKSEKALEVNEHMKRSDYDGTILKDMDGNTYKTVKIGNQIWMAENLKTAHYSDGAEIPRVSEFEKWNNLNYGAWCYYKNDEINDSIYGKLYNWFAVGTGRLCPDGWHIPTLQEFELLEDYVAKNYPHGYAAAGAHMKSLINWDHPNYATNKSGFDAQPGGERGGSEKEYEFGGMNREGYWWTSTEGDGKYAHEYAYYRELRNRGERFFGSDRFKVSGHSCRCIKDYMLVRFFAGRKFITL